MDQELDDRGIMVLSGSTCWQCCSLRLVRCSGAGGEHSVAQQPDCVLAVVAADVAELIKDGLLLLLGRPPVPLADGIEVFFLGSLAHNTVSLSFGYIYYEATTLFQPPFGYLFYESMRATALP